MDELEELKLRRLRELQQRQQEAVQNQAQEEAQLQEQIEQLESIIRQVFTKEALQRYGNLKSAHPEKAIHLLVILGQAIQQGKITSVNDNQLKELLKRLSPPKRDIKIQRM